MVKEEDKKTIGVIVRFFENDLPDKIGKNKDKIPFWGSGKVYTETSTTKSVKHQEEMFN